MELRYWLAEALTGTIGPEVRIQGQPRFVSRFGGGEFGADIMLGHLRRLDGGLDTAAIAEVLSWTVGGKFSLVVTSGEQCVGEWLIWRSDPVEEGGPVSVKGFELDGYPAFRSLNDDYVYVGDDQLNIAARLLRDAFFSFQDFHISVPWLSSGVIRSIEHKSHTAYYDEVLEEISAPVDGFQWRVVPEVTWRGGSPVEVTRRVQFGHPTLRNGSDVRLFQAGEGDRQGNVLSFPRPAVDFSKYAQSAYGWGRGEGAKQQWVGLSDPTLTNAGHLIVTKNFTFAGVSNEANLVELTRSALADAQELREPVQATVLADRIPSVPAVGDVVAVKILPNAAWPSGYSGSMQIGQVDLVPDGNHLNTLRLLAL